MTDDWRNALDRREILEAYVEVLNRLPELVEICAGVDGDAHTLRTAVEEAFGLSSFAADAVLTMQVRRFTPHERQKITDELADIETRLRRFDDA